MHFTSTSLKKKVNNLIFILSLVFLSSFIEICIPFPWLSSWGSSTSKQCLPNFREKLGHLSENCKLELETRVKPEISFLSSPDVIRHFLGMLFKSLLFFFSLLVNLFVIPADCLFFFQLPSVTASTFRLYLSFLPSSNFSFVIFAVVFKKNIFSIVLLAFNHSVGI